MNSLKNIAIIGMIALAWNSASLSAETKTATFDFTTNAYELNYMESSGGVPNYLTESVVLTENGASISLFTYPGNGNGYEVTWRKDLAALYYPKLQFIIFNIDKEAKFKTISMTFDGEYNANGKNFYTNKKYVFLSDLPYKMVDNTGTIDFTGTEHYSVCWQNNQVERLVIKQIVVTYDDGTSASIDNANTDSNSVVGGVGTINVTGTYSSIAVYNIGGVMIAKDKPSVNCPAGIYIVKVDGKARKVIVK